LKNFFSRIGFGLRGGEQNPELKNQENLDYNGKEILPGCKTRLSPKGLGRSSSLFDEPPIDINLRGTVDSMKDGSVWIIPEVSRKPNITYKLNHDDIIVISYPESK